MALSDHVTLTITNGTVGVARAGFGVPLILSVNAAWSERVRTYNAIEDVAADFATSSPEYLAASAIFSQEPHPETIMIGRCVGKPTTRYKVTVSTVEHSHTYKLTVKGQGVTTTELSVAADSATTDGEICSALVTALNGVVGKNYTATGATSPISITGTTAGDWFSIESTEPAYLKSEMDHVEPSPAIATDLTNIRVENDSWYAAYYLYNSDACAKALAAAIEPLNKICVIDLSNTETATLADGGSDTADDLQTLNYDRTAVMYHPSSAAMAGAAWLGARLPYTPGAATWKFVELDGVAPVTGTSTHFTNIIAKNANVLQTVADRAITREGVMVGGEFIDKIRDLDWLRDDLTKSVFEVLVANPKIPMTNAGIAIIEGAVRGSLRRAFNLGIIDADFTVTVPLVANIASSDRAIRKLPDVKFKCRMQGAIHKVEITGVVSV